MYLESVRRSTGVVLIALATMLASFVVIAPDVRADGGDFALDFVASEPTSYNHATGGGAYNDRTVNVDIVEQLEGGDFTCDDTVTYLLSIENSPTPSAANQTLAFQMRFLAASTGQPGAAHAAVTNVQVNYGAGDTGISDNGNSAIGTWGTSQSGATFVKPSEIVLDFTLTNLEAGESVVVQVDTTLACHPTIRATGNLQGALTGSTVIEEDGEATNDAITSGSGNQTIPFLQVGNIAQPGKIIVVKQTLPDGAAGVFHSTRHGEASRFPMESLSILANWTLVRTTSPRRYPVDGSS